MQELHGFDFRPVTIGDYDRVYAYTSVFGEGSCQHSPVSMYSQWEKYGDAICEEDGFLYTLRENLCDAEYRVYLAPLGAGDRGRAFARILADAAAHGRRVKFISLTERYAAALEEAFPGRFDITEERDLAEYFYHTAQMAAFSGTSLKAPRRAVHVFWRVNGAHCSVTRIRPEDKEDLLSFERYWLEQNQEDHDRKDLSREARMIEKQLNHFDALSLSGVVLRLDGQVRGFGYGTKLSGEAYDAIVEKGDRNVPHIYKVLRQESVKQCAMDCAYVNMEEDIGVPGLRVMKSHYSPAFLLRKFVAKESD